MNPSTTQAAPGGAGVMDPAKQAMVLAALYVAQEQQGYVTREAMEKVADRLGVPVSEVFSTASFYSLFRTEPAGRFVIQVCEGLSCYLSEGAERVVDYIGAKLGIQPGQTTADGRFTLVTVQCLASCGTAPAMRVNDQLYENLTVAGIDAALERLMGEV